MSSTGKIITFNEVARDELLSGVNILASIGCSIWLGEAIVVVLLNTALNKVLLAGIEATACVCWIAGLVALRVGNVVASLLSALAC